MPPLLSYRSLTVLLTNTFLTSLMYSAMSPLDILVLSAGNGELDGIVYAFELGASIDAQPEGSGTALHAALIKNQLESVSKLVELGANPHSLGVVGGKEMSCVRCAILCGNLDCFAALLGSPKFDPAQLVKRDFTIGARDAEGSFPPELLTMRSRMATTRKNVGLQGVPNE